METTSAYIRMRQAMRVGIAALVASALAIIGLVGVHTTASANETPTGWRVSVDYGNELHNGLPVVTPGKTYRAAIQYPNQPGGSATISIPDGIDLTLTGLVPGKAIEPPPGNAAVKTIRLAEDGTSLTVELQDKENWPARIDQGGLILDFVFAGDIEESGKRTVTWALPGGAETVEIYVRKAGDQWHSTYRDNLEKKLVNWPQIGSATIKDGVVILDQAAIEGVELQFQIIVDSEKARTIDLKDELGSHLEFVPNSFAAQLTTWDEDGFTATHTPVDRLPQVDGTKFSYSLDVPEDSRLTIDYRATINYQAVLDDLTQQLGNIDELNGGDIEWQATNKVIVGSTEKTAWGPSLKAHQQGTKAPGFAPWAAFDKSVSPSGDITIPAPGEAGEITPPIAITYTLKADLTKFVGTDTALESNVILKDSLQKGLRWLPDAEKFFTINGLDSAGAYSGDGSDFADDAHVGKYWVNGNEVWVNVGKDTTRNISVQLRAEAYTVAGVTPSQDHLGAYERVRYPDALENKLEVEYNSKPWGKTVKNTLVVKKTGGEEVTDNSKFRKSVKNGSEKLVVNQGATAEIPFTFTVAEGAVKDLSTSVIVDHIDHGVLEVTDDNLADIVSTISGSYNSKPVTGADFTATLNDEGDLELRLVEGFVDRAGYGNNKRLSFDMTIPTKALTEKKTYRVANTASLRGSHEEDYRYTTTTEGSASTFGSELETRKSVSADGNQWTQNLRLDLDESGQLVNDTVTYRIEAIAHGSYGSGLFVFSNILDQLDPRLEFLGFEGANGQLETEKVDLGGRVSAQYDQATRTITMGSQGQTFQAESGKPISLTFKAKIIDWAEGQAIPNSIPGSPTQVTPGTDFPLSIRKVDQDNPEKTITDENARFTITGPKGIVTTEAFVKDGFLVVAREGVAKTIMVSDPGEYRVTETKAPSGYQQSSETVTVIVEPDGSSEQVSFFNRPVQPEPEPQLGTFNVKKLINGVSDEEDVSGKSFEIIANWVEDGEEQSAVLTVAADGSEVNGPEVPVGTAVTLTEKGGESRAIPGYRFVNATISGDSVSGTSVTVGTAPSTVTVTNTYEKLPEPKIGTTVSVKGSEDKVLPLAGGALVDTVAYSGLIPGKEYSLRGEIRTAPGGEATGIAAVSQSFVAEQADGTVDVNFKISAQDAERFAGQRLVVFEYLTADGEPVAEHTDPHDENQTFTVEMEAPREPSFAIGDVVWVDTDLSVDPSRHGDQNNDDGHEGVKFLEGVTVKLFPAGKTDGDPIRTTTTNADGRYLFDLLEEGEYQIQFVLTKEQSSLFEFTSTKHGTDIEIDSDADRTTGFTGVIRLNLDNQQLRDWDSYALEYDGLSGQATMGIDPTWDAGVVLRGDTPVIPELPREEPENPAEPGEKPQSEQSTPALSKTGAEVGGIAGVAALALLAGGALLLFLRRRNVN